MRELAGKTAFVTGAASGIGFALGRAFAEAGMNVVLADIETDALAAAIKSLHDFEPRVLVHLAGSLSPFGVCVRRQGVCPSRSSGMASPSWH